MRANANLFFHIDRDRRLPGDRGIKMFGNALRVLVLLGAVGAMSPARAEAPVLSVQGSGRAQAFTMAELEALPQTTFATRTVWTDGVQTFSGPSLKSVLAATGGSGTTVSARALNDYVIRIPLESLADDAPIIATRLDGEHFPRREKGPLWIVYPYDSTPHYRTEVVYGRSIWQLKSLTLE